jgi:glycosyltransferase involved in cell wall biosynthesis
MKVSLIIATLNRTDDLARALRSVSTGTIQPDEVIIVEQGDIEKTKKLLENFKKLNIKLYALNIKSLTRARNFGISKSSGHILIFIDDDVELDKEYISNALRYMELHPELMGITGKDLLYARSYKRAVFKIFTRIFGVFFITSSFSARSRVLCSGHNTLRNVADYPQKVEWLSGCNMVIRKDVFDEGLSFNADFIRWSFGEDVMLTYQIFKRYPNSLQYVPNLLLKHRQSKESRLSNDSLIKMQIIYRYLFWKKEVSGTAISLISYLWSQIGISILILLKARSYSAIKNIFKSYHYIFKNRRNILSSPDSYNAFILDS